MKVTLPSFGSEYDGAKMRDMVNKLDLAFRSINTAVTQLQRYSAVVDMSSPTLFQKKTGLAGVTIGSAGMAGTDAAGAYTFFIDSATGAASFAGTITAGAGAIGGFDIGTDYVRDAANSFGLASTVTAGDDVRFWAGATFANRATAPLRFTEAGAAAFSSIAVTGGNIDTTGGYIRATGSVLESGSNAAIVGVPSTSGRLGVVGIGNSEHGIYGYTATTGKAGVLGVGTHASGYGVWADNTGGGYGLYVSTAGGYMAGALTMAASIPAAVDSAYDIGSGLLYFEDAYIEYLHTINLGCLEVAGLAPIASTALATQQCLTADTAAQADFYPGNSGSATNAGIDWPCWAWTINGMIVLLLDSVGDQWTQATWN